jgi:hypothetical protein
MTEPLSSAAQTVPACSSRTDRGRQRSRIRSEQLAIVAELSGAELSGAVGLAPDVKPA